MSESKDIELCIYGGTALTMNAKLEIIEDAVLNIIDGKIHSLSSSPGFQPNSMTKSICANGALVLPGFVNGHTHVGMGLFRGIAEEMPMQEWLRKVIFPLEKKWNSAELVKLASQLSIIEMLRAGVTTFNDMYYFESVIAETAYQLGVNAICGQTIVELGNVEDVSSSIVETMDAFLSDVASFEGVWPAIAPHSVYGLSEEHLKTAVKYAEDQSIHLHVHVSETEEEVQDALSRFGATPPVLLDRIGAWEQKSIAAHGCSLREGDIEVLAGKNVGMSHNPESNLKLATKICPVGQIRQAGIPMCFGTDSVASNNDLEILREADTGCKLQSYKYGPGTLKAVDAVKMLTCEGARALSLGDITGSLEIGKQADVLVMSLSAPHATPMYDPYTHLVYSAKSTDLTHVVSRGKVLLEAGNLQTISESDVLNESRRISEKIAAER